MPWLSIAMLGFTAAKNGIAISARKVGFARFSRIDQDLALRGDAGHRARLALVPLVGADDVVHERDRGRALLLVRRTLEGALERRSRDG